VTFQSGSVLEVAVPGIYGAPLVLDNGAIIRLSDAGALGGAGSPQLTAAMISPDASHKHVVQLNASGSFTNLANVGANTVLEIYGADRTITGSALTLAKTFYLTNDNASRTILNNATNNLTISAATTLAATSGTTLTIQEAIVGGAFDLTVGYAGTLDGLDKTNGTVNVNGATAIGGSVLIQSGVLAIGDGAESAMLAGTLAADVRVPDGRRAQLLFPVGATRKDVGQKISILGGTTGDRSLTVSRSTGASPVAVNLNNLYLAAGAVLSIEEDNSDVRFGAKLAGAATLVKNAANSSDVDIASLASDTAGTARQFQIGRTTDSLSTNVYGSVSSDVTVTINNAAVSFQPGASLAGTVNFNNAASGTLTINAGQDGAAGLAAGTINLGSAGRTLTGYVNETAAAPALTNAVGTLINVAAADADLNTVDAVLKAGRNLTATLPGTVHFSNVALPANATLEGQSDNNAVLKASLTLAGDVAYKNDSGASVTLGNVSGGTTRTLYLIGAGATPINGTITAKRLVVGTASVAGAGTVTNSSALALADKVLETANGTLTVNGVAGVPADHAFYVNGPSAVVNFAVTALGTVDPADSSKPLVASITGSAAGGKVTLPDTGAGGEKVKLTGAINLSQTTLAQPDTDQGGVNMTRTFYYNPTSYTDTANSKLALGSIAAGTSTTPSGTELQNYGGYFIASATVNAKVLHSAQTGTARPILLGARGSSTTLTFKGMMDLYTLQGNNGLDTSNKSALGLGTQSSGTVVIDPAAAIRSTVVTAGALSDSQPVYFGGDGTGTVKFMPGFVNNHVTNTGGAGSYAIDPASYASRQWIIGRAHVETGATQNLPYGTETVNAATGLPATFGGSITFAIANGGVWKVGTANQVYGGQVQASVGGTIDVSDSVGDGTGTALRLDQNGKVVLDAARTLTKSGKGTLQINGSTSFGDGANLRVSAGTLNFAQPAGSTVTVGATTALTLTIESGSPGGTVNVDATGRDPFTDSAIAIRHINVLNNSATGLNVNAGAATIAGLGGTGTTSVASGAALTVTGSISQPLLSLAGLLNLGGGLDMSGASGGTLNWELKTLKDLTNGAAGTDFGGVSLTGGDLKLGGDAGNALLTLDFSLLSSGAGPNGGDPFWSNPHAWKVIDVTSPGTNNTGLSFKSITNGLGWTAGYFTTSVGTGADAGDILLKYNTGSAVTFSGSAKWSGPNQGGWATDANWTDTASGHEGIHKAPGWAPPASQVAVLQGTPGAAAMSVNLGTATPTLNTMTFQPDTGNNDTLFVIGGATGDGKITLQDAALARIDVSGSKTQEIGVPLTLASPTKITTNGAGSQLKISGDIRDGGPNVILTKDGPGTLVLSGTNDYDQMVVSAGTVEIVAAHAVALGGKPLTIASGATVWFDVDIVYGAASRSPATRAVSVSPVPEPCTLALFGVAGVAALAVWLKRRLRR
jgi:autotransporter-associated beta strand protein